MFGGGGGGGWWVGGCLCLILCQSTEEEVETPASVMFHHPRFSLSSEMIGYSLPQRRGAAKSM